MGLLSTYVETISKFPPEVLEIEIAFLKKSAHGDFCFGGKFKLLQKNLNCPHTSIAHHAYEFLKGNLMFLNVPAGWFEIFLAVCSLGWSEIIRFSNVYVTDKLSVHSFTMFLRDSE